MSLSFKGRRFLQINKSHIRNLSTVFNLSMDEMCNKLGSTTALRISRHVQQNGI